jgi:hypothetical protein
MAKRPSEDSPADSTKTPKKPRTKPRKPKKPKGGDLAFRGLSVLGAASKAATDDGEQEEGEVVEGDFSDLFMVDVTPSAIPAEAAYVGAAAASPVKAGGEQKAETKMEEKARLLAQEEAEMRAFAEEVLIEESDEDDDEDDEEEEEGGQKAMPYGEDVLYEDEEALQAAIRGKIVDDSAAKTTGRYYKETDLTRSCALCGGAYLRVLRCCVGRKLRSRLSPFRTRSHFARMPPLSVSASIS